MEVRELKSSSEVSEARTTTLISHLTEADAEAGQLHTRNAALEYELNVTAQLTKVLYRVHVYLCLRRHSYDKVVQ